MYRLIESYGVTDETVTVAGRTLPVPSLVEDADGVRLMLLGPAQADRVLVDAWVQAHSSGAALLVLVRDGGYQVLTAEEFLATRGERPGGVLVPVGWRSWSGPAEPTFRATLVPSSPSTGIEVSRPRFVSFHTHSEFSPLDGLSTVAELVDAAAADGQPALSLADHGNCSGHPDLQVECDRVGIKPIFGMEAYFVPDRHRRGRTWVEEVDGKEVKRSDSQEALREYTHICLWALDDDGLRRLWAMSTEANREGFYGKPRLDWDTLARLGAGVAASTGCLGGPVAQALLAGDELAARAVMARLMELFPDRLYVELHTNHLPEQMAVNERLVVLAREFGVPLLAVTDSHYTSRADQQLHHAWIALATGKKDLSEDTGMFGGGQSYHHHTAAEVAEALGYLDERFGDGTVVAAMAETVRLAERCTARMTGTTARPVYSRGEDAVQRDVERLTDMCLGAWHKLPPGADQDVYTARFEREMGLFVSRRLCGFMLVTADLVRWAKSQGILVGPGRGSGGASLVAYLASITELDPVHYDLPFERFLTEEREEMPDFDIDFPESKRDLLEGYLRQRWGAEHVVRIGNHIRLRPLQAIEDAVRILRPTLPYEVVWEQVLAVKKIVKDYAATLAGATVRWRDLWAQHGEELAAYRDNYPEIFDLVDGIVDRLKTYGKHASGVLISTGGPLTHLPLRRDADGNMVTQFDFRQLDKLGYLKYDVLTLRTLDTLQAIVDMVQERYGRRIDFYGWREEYQDPQVWSDLAAGHTLGVFQIETSAGTKITRRFAPESIAHLAAIVALNRPGPLDSGLAETYLRRRHGEEEVAYLDPRLVPVLAETYGTYIYQEQIMRICQVLANYGAGEADTKVRKPIGKKLGPEKMAQVGVEFCRRAVECGTDQRAVEQLWAAMSQFARYAFGKAHSVGYAVLGYWTAWCKTHYPLEFFTSALSTVDNDRVPDFIGEARRMGYRVLPPCVNTSGVGFTPAGTVVRYGLGMVKGVGMVPARQIVAGQPYTDLDDFLARAVQPTGSKVNYGHVRILAAIGAFDAVYPHRRALEQRLEQTATGQDRLCAHHDPAAVGPGGLPCRYDWTAEPDPPLVSKGRGKARVLLAKPPPARCTVACRRYTPRAAPDPDSVRPYTDDDIRAREREMLGVWLSSTPFDRLDSADLAAVHRAGDVESGPAGEYVVAALVARVTQREDRNGRRYAWLTLSAQDGDLDVSCWADAYAKYRHDLVVDRLVVAVLRKDGRGVTLTGMAPV